MTDRTIDASQHKAARVAGFMFLFSLIVPLLNWVFVLSKFVVAENVTATANNIMANEFQFRIGITIELIMSVGLIVLGLALYNTQTGKQESCFACAFLEAGRGDYSGRNCACLFYCFADFKWKRKCNSIYTRTVAGPRRINSQHTHDSIFYSHGIPWPGHDGIFLFIFQIEVYTQDISRLWNPFICAYFHSRFHVYSCTRIRSDAD